MDCHASLAMTECNKILCTLNSKNFSIDQTISLFFAGSSVNACKDGFGYSHFVGSFLHSAIIKIFVCECLKFVRIEYDFFKCGPDTRIYFDRSHTSARKFICFDTNRSFDFFSSFWHRIYFSIKEHVLNIIKKKKKSRLFSEHVLF